MKNDRISDGSVRLAWAITIAYGILYCGILFIVSQYWLMLPIWLRSIVVLGLLGIAGIGALRIRRTYKASSKAPKTKDEE